MKAIVVGCGRVGSAVAKKLTKSGWDVTAIDENEEALARLGGHWTGGGGGGARRALDRRVRRRSRHGRARPARGRNRGGRRRRRRDERGQHEHRRRPGR